MQSLGLASEDCVWKSCSDFQLLESLILAQDEPPLSRGLTVPGEEAPANSVPAAAVIRRVRALSGITGRKGRVGGFLSGWGNPGAQLRGCRSDWRARAR